MRIRLTVTGGPHSGRVFEFDRHDQFIVGRSKDAHFRMPKGDQYFSRFHFLAELNPPRCRLYDLDSTNGTFVNGRRVREADLADGDTITAGVTELCVAVVADGTAVGPTEIPETIAPGTVDAPPADRGRDDGPGLPPPRPAAPSATGPTAGVPQRPDSPSSSPCCTFCPGATSDLRGESAICPSCEAEARALPQPIAGYRMVRLLGKGGMGMVHLARRRADDAPVAIKTIVPALSGSPAMVGRFLREADILRQLDHPNIVRFVDMGAEGDQLYFATSYVRGTDASRFLKDRNGRPMPVVSAVRLVGQLLRALEYAHGLGFVHRDIKPANLMIESDGPRRGVRLTDFGLARVYNASQLSGLTLMGDTGGSFAYMAPEQVTHYRDALPAADQYAAAATLYKLLTGSTPMDLKGSPQAQLLQILQGTPVPIRRRRPELPDAMAEVVHRALSRDPADRFPDVAAFRAALRPFAGV